MHRRLEQSFDAVQRFLAVQAYLDPRMQFHPLALVGPVYFLKIGEHHAFATGVDALAGQIVQAKHHVLRGDDDRLTVGRTEDVVGRHHQCASFKLCLNRQRYVYRHLVAIEVGVEGGADQRVQLNGLTLDQGWLEGLDAQTV